MSEHPNANANQGPFDSGPVDASGLFESLAVDLTAGEFLTAVEAGDISTVVRIIRESRDWPALAEAISEVVDGLAEDSRAN